MRKMLPIARPVGKSGVYFLGLLLWEGLAHCGQCPCRDGGIGGGVDRGVGGAGGGYQSQFSERRNGKGEWEPLQYYSVNLRRKQHGFTLNNKVFEDSF